MHLVQEHSSWAGTCTSRVCGRLLQFERTSLLGQLLVQSGLLSHQPCGTCCDFLVAHGTRQSGLALDSWLPE